MRHLLHRPLTMFGTLLLLFSLGRGLSTPLSAQTPDPRIRAVEVGLSRGIQVKGKEGERFTIQERMKEYRVPGVSIAVMDGGRIVYAKGYGVTDVNSGEPVTSHTLFQAASISKPLTAMAALKLVEEGRLSLDEPVNQYLKSWKIPENEFTEVNPVTLAQLLSHTGGLTVHGFPGYAVADRIPTTVEVLDGSEPANTGPIRVDTVPGTLWRYSGGGYTIVQKLIEDVTGEPFPEVLKRLVLDPAGMTESSYQQPLPPAGASHAASAHLSDGSPVPGKWHIYPEMAAAGLWTTPTELAKLAMTVQASAHGSKDGILSPAMTERQLTPVMGGYGLGFGIAGAGDALRFSHGGSNHGFKASFTAFVEGGRGVFIMTNGDGGSALAQEMALAVAREFGFPFPRYREVILAELPASTLEEIAGAYQVVGQDLVFTIETAGDHLRIVVPGEDTMEVHPTAEDFFIDLVSGNRFRVERDKDGGVTAVQLLGGARAERIRK